MPTADEFAVLLKEIRTELTPGRTESAAQLAWFMRAAWRLDPADIPDAICDGAGDKGIDGLSVDDDAREIVVFQSKFTAKQGADQGDKDIRNLVGAGAYFRTPPSVAGLLAAEPNKELRQLLERHSVADKVADGGYAVRLVFVTTATLDSSGRGYVASLVHDATPLDVWDAPRLSGLANRTARPGFLPGTITLFARTPPLAIDLTPSSRMVVAVVEAAQLLNLPGIDDSSIFARNVRLHLGRTRINQELQKTIANSNEHSLFPAYHNGITILTNGLTTDASSIVLDGVSVVNGCQSLITLSQNRGYLTQELSLLVKIVQAQDTSALSDTITYRSNNQTPVDIRDQRSTDSIQRDLQTKCAEIYGDRFGLTIREGERSTAKNVLDNTLAAQLIMAVYLEEPWNAVRKIRLFDQDYRRIFSRSISAEHLFLLYTIDEVIGGFRNTLDPTLASSFSSVRFTLADLIAQAFRESEGGKDLLANPQDWIPDNLDAVKTVAVGLGKEIVQSVNFFVRYKQDRAKNDDADSFDPKVVFKSETGVKEVREDVIRDLRRQEAREAERGASLFLPKRRT